MPWRLIGFILLFGIFLVFIGFNLGNVSDVSLGFTLIQNVPVYLTAFTAFILGMFAAIPFIVSVRRKKNLKNNQKKASIDAPGPNAMEVMAPPRGDKKERKLRGKSKKQPQDGDAPVMVTEIGDIPGEGPMSGGSYGID